MIDLLRDSCVSLISESLNRPVWSHAGVNKSTRRAAILALGADGDSFLKPLTQEDKWTSEGAVSMSDMVSFGIKPSECSGEVRKYWREVSFSKFSRRGEEYLSHPLFMAMMFSKLLEDREEADRLFAYYESLPDQTSWGDFWSATWVPPYKPSDFGRGVYSTPKEGDSVSMICWFDNEQIERSFDVSQGLHNYDNLAGVILRAGSTMSLSPRADRGLLRVMLNSGSRPHYPTVTHLARLASKSGFEMALQRVSGSKLSLGIVRRDSPSELMVKGLRTVSSMKEDAIITFSALYGRSPTTEEIQQVRGSGLINLLYYMPWDILEEMLDAGSEKIRAKTLPHLDMLAGEKRYCLQKHTKRATLLPYAGVEKGRPARVTANTSVDDWKAVYSGLARQYSKSRKLREELKTLTGDPAVAIASLLPAFKAAEQEVVERVLRHHPKFKEIKDLLNGFEEPTSDPNSLIL